MKTTFARALYEGREDEVAQDYPMKRLGLPTDTAKAAAGNTISLFEPL